MCNNQDCYDAQYRNTTVLIVEDNTILGKLLQEALLESIHCQVRLVVTAEMAIETLQTITPALFVLDYLLPQMNGLQLADHLQRRADTGHLPIIMISATLPEDVSLRKQIKYVRKPFDLEAFLQLVVQLLPPSIH